MSYSTSAASAATGASRQAIRSYAIRHARYFSTEGSPDSPGQPRQFTDADLKLIVFIRMLTTEHGYTHDEVAEQLGKGSLDEFTWEPPEAPSAPGEPSPVAEGLVPVERVQAALALAEDAREREGSMAVRLEEAQAAAQARIDELESEIRQLERENGKLQGEIGRRYRAPEWWRKLFGGREDE